MAFQAVVRTLEAAKNKREKMPVVVLISLKLYQNPPMNGTVG